MSGTIIPPLPEKRWTGNMDATFVEERRQALEYFIVRDYVLLLAMSAVLNS